MRRLLALGLLGLCVTGCASQGMQRVLTPNDRLRDEVRELERLVVELQRKATVSEVEIGRLKERGDLSLLGNHLRQVDEQIDAIAV